MPKVAGKKGRKNVRQKRSCVETLVRRMQAVGTYRKQFAAAIDRLAEIYVQMDELLAEFEAEGREILVEHTNKAGATNVQVNPLMGTWLQMQAQALAAERELGLTPAGLKKMGTEQKQGPDKVAALLEKFGGE